MKTPFDELKKWINGEIAHYQTLRESGKMFHLDRAAYDTLRNVMGRIAHLESSQSPAVTEVDELPTTTEVINYSKEYSCLNFKRGPHEQLNAMSDFREGAECFRGKVSPIISSLKKSNEDKDAQIEHYKELWEQGIIIINELQKQEEEDRSVEFAEWLCKKGYDSKQIAVSPRWGKTWTGMEYTSAELYQIFLKETSSNGEGKE